jgi:two-component system chemotaxis response regulator CheB
VGHAYSPQALATEQGEALEMALWAGLRALQERADLFNRLARRAVAMQFTKASLERKAARVEQHVEMLRDLLTQIRRDGGPTPEELEGAAGHR